MNLALRGIEANLGQQPADTFLRDLHPDLKADYILANPPFNDRDWSGNLLREESAHPGQTLLPVPSTASITMHYAPTFGTIPTKT